MSTGVLLVAHGGSKRGAKQCGQRIGKCPQLIECDYSPRQPSMTVALPMYRGWGFNWRKTCPRICGVPYVYLKYLGG